jgi:hypothetical protein
LYVDLEEREKGKGKKEKGRSTAVRGEPWLFALTLFLFPFSFSLLFRALSPVAAGEHTSGPSTHPSGRLVADGGVVVRRGE